MIPEGALLVQCPLFLFSTFREEVKNLRRTLSALVFVLLLSLSLAASANAAELVFEDVSVDSPWFDAVTYAAEAGITNGTGDYQFSPDRNVSVRQWAVMICRAYDKKPVEIPNAEFGIDCIDLAFSEGWLNLYALADPASAMTRQSLYESAFKVAGLNVYDYQLYGDPELDSQADMLIRIAADNGLCVENANPHDLITRGEAVYVIYKLAQETVEAPVPPIMSKLEIQNKDGVTLDDYLQEIQQVPEIIVDEFAKRNWAYHVDSNYLADLSIRYDMNCIGATSYQKRIIYSRDPKSTVHEFGHFYHLVVGFPTTFDDIYEAENENARKVLGDYATRNAKEYFAESFDYWIVHQDNPDKLASLQKVAPRTYSFLLELETDGWID